MTARVVPHAGGDSDLDPNRLKLTAVADPVSGDLAHVQRPELQNVAQGYRQHQTLADLLAGVCVRNPVYWQRGRRVKPRRSELASWQHFRERLTAAGYALEVLREPGCQTGDETYRLLEIEAPQ